MLPAGAERRRDERELTCVPVECHSVHVPPVGTRVPPHNGLGPVEQVVLVVVECEDQHIRVVLIQSWTKELVDEISFVRLVERTRLPGCSKLRLVLWGNGPDGDACEKTHTGTDEEIVYFLFKQTYRFISIYVSIEELLEDKECSQ